MHAAFGENTCLRRGQSAVVTALAIADAAEDAASKAFLRGLIRLAGRGRPEERPTFQELLDRVDQFIAKPLPQTSGPEGAVLYKSSVIQEQRAPTEVVLGLRVARSRTSARPAACA